MRDAIYCGVKFSDNDILNPEDYIPADQYNPHARVPWLLHDHGFTLCVVFADTLQDALDEAADGRIDGDSPLARFRVNMDLEEDELSLDVSWQDYGDTPEEAADNEALCYLGNRSEMYDLENVKILQLPNPKASFVAQFNQQGYDEQPSPIKFCGIR